jgi:hypothetical protein
VARIEAAVRPTRLRPAKEQADRPSAETAASAAIQHQPAAVSAPGRSSPSSADPARSVTAAPVHTSAASSSGGTRAASPSLPSHRSGGLLLVAAGSALGSAVATPLGVFLVEPRAHAAFSPGAAGALLAAASVSSIAARVLGGIHADRFAARQLRWVAAMLAVGAGGSRPKCSVCVHPPAFIAPAALVPWVIDEQSVPPRRRDPRPLR